MVDKAHVLVVDDSPDRVQDVRSRLTALGCSVSMVRSAHGALSLLSSGVYSLVVVNWFLEDMMLHDFAEMAKRIRPGVLVMVTFDRNERFRPRGLDYPYVDGWVPYACNDQALRGLADMAKGSRPALLA